MNRFSVAVALAVAAGFAGYAGHEVAAFWCGVGAFILAID